MSWSASKSRKRGFSTHPCAMFQLANERRLADSAGAIEQDKGKARRLVNRARDLLVHLSQQGMRRGIRASSVAGRRSPPVIPVEKGAWAASPLMKLLKSSQGSKIDGFGS